MQGHGKRNLYTGVLTKDHQAVITDEAGTVSTYTLNDKGYATTCTSQDRQRTGCNLATDDSINQLLFTTLRILYLQA